MAVKNPQFELNLRKNTNANNPGYGKYYPKAKEKKTISQQAWPATTASTAATSSTVSSRS